MTPAPCAPMPTARRTPKTTATLAAVASLSVLTSCGPMTISKAAGPSHKSTAPSSKAASTPPSSSQQVPNHGAPKVPHPLDASAFKKAPCSVLTPQQLDQLGVHAQGEPDMTNSLGPTCDWADIDGPTHGSYGVTFVKGGAGLSGAYANRNRSFFKPIEPIAGQPAAISMAGDARAEGDCNLAVGLNDHLAISVGAELTQDAPNYKNPCGVAAKLAEKMIETIKGRQ